ncbi:hypothetical protein R3I94_002562 [Phoxinus phoxinus]
MTAAIAEEWTPEAPVTEEVKKICIQIKSDLEKKTGHQFDVFIPKTYRSEPKCGGHYLLKVKVGDDKHLIVMLCPGGGTEDICQTVKGFQYAKSESQPLEPFVTLSTACGK